MASVGSASSQGADNQLKEEKANSPSSLLWSLGLLKGLCVCVLSKGKRESFKMLIGRLRAKGGKYRDKKMPPPAVKPIRSDFISGWQRNGSFYFLDAVLGFSYCLQRHVLLKYCLYKSEKNNIKGLQVALRKQLLCILYSKCRWFESWWQTQAKQPSRSEAACRYWRPQKWHEAAKTTEKP